MMADPVAKVLGEVVSWETYPPAAGRILFRSAGDVPLATGRFRVVLSYGPGAAYTMAWAVDAYRALGIPVVPRGLRTEPATNEPASRDAALVRARSMIAATAFPFWAGDLLLEVTDLGAAEDEGGILAPPPLLSLPLPVEPVADRVLEGAEKRAILDNLDQIGLRAPVRTALIFVLEDVEDELELSRNDVTRRDVEAVTRAYWLMPTWTQRVGVAYLLQDHGATPEALDVWFDVLRAPDQGPDSLRHIVKSAALAWLRGDVASMDRYLDDYELTRAHVRIFVQVLGG